MSKNLQLIAFYGRYFAAFRMLIGAISVVYMLNYGMAITDIGWLKSYQALLILLLDIPTSYIADRYSRKFSICTSGALAVLWLLLMGIAEHKWQFYLAETFNALSLCLFQGAFIAYLIATKNHEAPELSIKQLLGAYHKKESLLMAICAFCGAAFVSVSSRLPWLVAASLIFMLVLYGIYRLPADTHQHTGNAQQKGLQLLAHNGKSIYHAFIHNRTLQHYFFTLIIIAFIFQTLLQFWQPLLSHAHLGKTGLIYASLFALILLAQSLASRCVEKTSLSPAIILALFLVAIVLLLLNTALNFLLIDISAIFLLFFTTRFFFIEGNANFHETISDDHRATFDSLTSLCNRLVMMLFFPLLTHIGQTHFTQAFALFLLPFIGIYGYLRYRKTRATN